MAMKTLKAICALFLVQWKGIENVQRKESKGLRIMGGDKVIVKEFPFMVSIHYKLKDQYVHHCGGVIVTQYWVISAAHCHVKEFLAQAIPLTRDCTPKKIIAGTVTIENSTALPSEQERTVERVIIHDDFLMIPGNVQNDLALYKVTEPFEFNAYVNKINLPTKKFEVPPGTSCKTMGWGRTEYSWVSTRLLKLSVMVVRNEECEEALTNEKNKREICVASDKGHDTCDGDSGGPIVCRKKILAGVLSRGTNSCPGATAAVYTRVAYYLDWIHKYVNLTHLPPEERCNSSDSNVSHTRRADYPFMVNIIGRHGDVLEFCIGVIVAKVWVLSASSCVKPEAEVAIYGGTLEKKTRFNHCETPSEVFIVVRHEVYDAALLKIMHEFSFDKFVQPATFGRELNRRELKKTCSTFGWGLTTEGTTDTCLRTFKVRIPSKKDNTYLRRSDCVSEEHTNVSTTCVVDLDYENTKAFSGPLVCNGKLVGIYSAGYSSHMYHWYTDVSQLVNWIYNETKDSDYH